MNFNKRWNFTLHNKVGAMETAIIHAILLHATNPEPQYLEEARNCLIILIDHNRRNGVINIAESVLNHHIFSLRHLAQQESLPARYVEIINAILKWRTSGDLYDCLALVSELLDTV